ncbi:lysophospholipase L1-like esterase [Novosphingobium chloroacetimidivorans]|uniref:Lysophospholipase L1-like esterase n=1 Tax=Novosphingobium chloroacetimidivorans TaxID=1428314 RepID=A0A7W7KDA8_9SPHN|nr:GDSL-type esterase/lipase family protein [Novosphingobium chloroacetimidivorans]MBB4860385.1 lysophospholipase L1-like esterase [Novosphingobium chloroacetimidivorans]
MFQIAKSLKQMSLSASEAAILSYVPTDADGVREDLTGRKFVFVIYTGNQVHYGEPGIHETSGSDVAVYWRLSGLITAGLVGKANLLWELSEALDDSREVIAQGSFVVGASAPASAVPDNNAVQIARTQARITRKNNPLTLISPEFLVDYLPYPLAGVVAPAPSFSVAPSVTGVATVGNLLTGHDGTYANGTVSARAWLKAGVVISGATSATYTPNEAGSYTYRVILTGAGGTTTQTSAAFVVAPVSITLNPLLLNGTLYTGVPASGVSLSGYTAGSTATINIPGLSVDSAGNITGTPTATGIVSVTETNAAASNSPRTSDGIYTVTAPAPVNIALPTITGTAQEGQTLTVSNGTWSGSPTSYTYQWLRDGVAISGSINSTRILTSVDIGATITARVTANNETGSTSATSAASAVVIAATVALPVNSVAPVVTGTAAVGSTLTTNNGTWSGNPTYTYQWRVDGVNITGATASTYVVQASDAGKAITSRVTATNAGGSAPAISNEIAIASSGGVQWVAEGDSITQGMGADNGTLSYPHQTLALLSNKDDVTNFRNNGSSGISLLLNGILANQQTRVLDRLDMTKSVRLASLLAGTNDGAGRDQGAIYGGYRTWVRKCRAAGYNRTVVSTNVAFRDNYEGADIVTNQMIRSFWNSDLDSDGLFDFGAPSCLGVFDQAYFWDDRHPNTAGYAKMAAVADPVVETVTQTTPGRILPPTTWHAYDVAAVLKTNGGRTLQNNYINNSTTGAMGFRSVTSGKWYFEVAIDAIGTASKIMIGLATREFETVLASALHQRAGMAMGYVPSTGAVLHGSSTAIINAGTSTTGDVIGVAFDATAKRVWFRKNGGQWNGSATANPSTGAEGVDFSFLTDPNISAAVSIVGANNGSQVTSRFAGSQMTGALPSGFSPIGGQTVIPLPATLPLPVITSAPVITGSGAVSTSHTVGAKARDATRYLFHWKRDGATVNVGSGVWNAAGANFTASYTPSAAGQYVVELYVLGAAGYVQATSNTITVA